MSFPALTSVLKMCGLEDYGDAIIGYLGVEHRKRTTIGVELAAKV
jgi:ATP-binding cassette subfamily G (WHITE) protein 2 (SNQ2)